MFLTNLAVKRAAQLYRSVVGKPKSATGVGRWFRQRFSASRMAAFDLLLTSAMCGLLWLCIGLVLHQQREFLLRDAIHDTDNLARAFEENTLRTVDAVDRTLLFLRSSYSANPDAFDLASWQRGAKALDELTLQLSIVDRTGLLRVSSLGSVRNNINLADREHFQVQATSKQDTLFISKPVMGRESDKWSIQFTRKIIDADGSFAGVAVVSLDPFSLARIYASLNIGRGTVLLAGMDGVVRAGAPISTSTIGQDITSTPLLAAARSATQGMLDAAHANNDGQLLSFRRLDRYGLVVAVGLNQDEVLASYISSRTNYLIGGSLLTALILLIGIWVARYRMILSRTQDRLAKSQEMLTDTLEHMGQGILMVGPNRDVMVINQRAAELLGVPSSSADIGSRLDELIKRQGDEAAEPQAAAACFERTQPDGKTLEVLTRQLSNSRSIHTLTDVTGRKQAEAKIVYLAHHDGLTGLANRTYFHDRLAHAINLTRRNRASFALLCLDLDRFKQVNDARGHDVGDHLLRMVAERLRASVRDSDTVARFGGDEFAVLQSNVEQPSAAANLGERLAACLAEPYVIDGAQFVIGASIGIALHPDDGRTADHLLKSADIALYKAKEDGRGRACFFEPEMDNRLQERHHLEKDLRDAIAQGHIEVRFQPICDVSSGYLLAYEALAYWTRPGRGPIPPQLLARVAEETGQIGALGHSVLRTACQQALAWPSHVRLFVDLATPQLLEPDCQGQVLQVLQDTGLEPSRLGLEVTEGAFVRNSKEALSVVQALRTHGVAVCLDHFGREHAGLGHILRFPFDCIKLDATLVERAAAEPAAEAVIRAIVLTGEFLGIGIMADGVKTGAQLALLRDLGCNQVQGDLVDKPVPARDVIWNRSFHGPGGGADAASFAPPS